MSQHDMVIANADGATVRADMNAALQALASTSKGNARPSTVYAGQLWLDDNTPSATEWTLYLYDGADDIPVGTFDSVANAFEPTIGSALALHADGYVFAADTDTGLRRSAADTMTWKTGGTDRTHLNTVALMVGTTDTSPHDNSGNNPGIALQFGGYVLAAVFQDRVAIFNRCGTDGSVVEFAQDGTVEGNVSISGTTVTYNAFAGAHWSQFEDGRRPELPRGTILSTVDAMAEWKAVEFTTRPRVVNLRPSAKWITETVEEDVEVLDRGPVEGDVPVTRTVVVEVDGVRTTQRMTMIERQVVQQSTTRIERRPVTKRRKEIEYTPEYGPAITKHVLYKGDAKPGDRIEYDYNGELVMATVVLEKNDRLACCKVSDVGGDRAVYGVFNGYDEDGDISVMALGAATIRVAKDQAPQIGDLLESDGTGCARVQADDVVRASTIAKVTSATPVETYGDGSFLVPCTLMCG